MASDFTPKKKAELPPPEEKYQPQVHDVIAYHGQLHLVLDNKSYYLHTLSDTHVTHRNLRKDDEYICFVKHLADYTPEKKYKITYKWEGRNGNGAGELLQDAVMGGVKTGTEQFFKSGQCPDFLTSLSIKEFVAFPEAGLVDP